MSKIRTFGVEEITPDRQSVLQLQGIPPDGTISGAAEVALKKAFEEFERTASVTAIVKEISIDDFREIYIGEGLNEEDTPVQEIYPRSSALALFAATLGPKISQSISTYFELKDYAIGYMLDSVASVSADKAAELLQNIYASQLPEAARQNGGIGVMRYSPGYCGWHVTAQRTLFAYLNPSEIGITLNKSCLMQPIKSVSGVMIAGPKEIHVFPNSYGFCAHCKTRTCRDRIRSMLLE